ncbi:MAG: class I SAM-dependent methyltransferase [Solirubrobacteraceae bacterium]
MTRPSRKPESAEPTQPEEPSAAVEPSQSSTARAEDFARRLQPGNLELERTTVSNLLYERLSQADITEAEERIVGSPDLPWDYATAPTEALRRFLLLAYSLWLGLPTVAERTGLLPQHPPEDVHAMARGPLAAAGGLYEADLVVDALASAGVEMASIRSALDVGCSSGRVVRVLAAAYPEIEWQGCDPNVPAISWASENLPGIEFFVNGDTPPLPLADGSLDLVYAISIWSHFAPELGLRWFEEMHRLLRPEGHLVCTTHGVTSIAHYATGGLRTVEQSEEIRDALYLDGHWYAPEFGEEGDWGVVNPDWGTAFLSPEWMLTQLCPHWRVVEFAPGRNQDNQDVYVLQRV